MQTKLSRRQVLCKIGGGFGALGLASLLADNAHANEAWKPAGNPLSSKAPHFAARAKRVIFLFMQGGPSHVDTFDYKPRLQQDSGKQVGGAKLLGSPFKFSRNGKSGLWISELFPNLARHADDLCVLNGMHCDNPAHPQAT